MTNRRPVIGKLITPEFRLASRSPASLEFKVLSPTGVINSNMGGIGLGIVAALGNIPAKKGNFSCRIRMLSDPIPVTRSRTDGGLGKTDKVCSLDEDYSVVISNKPINKSLKGKDSIFNISPARFDDDDDMRVPQPAGFLNSCHLCNKRLHGKDIYMYRGEKAFCSPECRSRQIAMDERPEKYCCSHASSTGDSRVIATGIFAI